MKPKKVGDRPWLTPGAIEFLATIVDEKSVVLETGAGGSTVWLAQKVARVVTFEHNPLWAMLTRKALEAKGLRNVSLVLDPDYPTKGLLSVPRFIFDLFLVDGRGRCLSIRTGLSAVRAGGWIFLDNADRERYSPIIKELDERFTTQIKFGDGWEAKAWRT